MLASQVSKGLVPSLAKFFPSIISVENVCIDAMHAHSAVRSFSTDGGSGDGEGDAQPATDAAPAEASTADAGSSPEKPTAPSDKKLRGEGVPPTTEDLVAMGYTKRQAAWISPDPEKHKHFLPRLARKELGNYTLKGAAMEFAQETNLYPKVPKVPLYNLRDVVPEMIQPRSGTFDLLQAAQASNPDASILELAELAGIPLPSAPDSPPGEPILEWDLRLVMSAGVVGEPHPANKKAKCRVHLRALQRNCQLSDDALQYIAEIAGPRYDANTGVLTLTSERFAERELNRKDIVRMLRGLVDEGKKVDRGEDRALPAEKVAVGEL